MVAPESVPSRFDRLGGVEPLRLAVDLIYLRLTAMESTKHYFAGIRTDGVKRHMVVLLASILGSPDHQYNGLGLKDAHAQLHIPEDDYLLVTGVIIDVLAHLSVDEDTIGYIARALYGVKWEIIDPAAVRLPG